MKKKILNCFGLMNYGGAEKMYMNIYRYIDKYSYTLDFLVFSDKNGFFDEEILLNKSKIFRLKSISNIGLIRYCQQLIIFFYKNKYDIVHIHLDWIGGIIALCARVMKVKKIIVHSHANQMMYQKRYNGIYSFIVPISKLLVTFFAHKILACSDIAGKTISYGRRYKIIKNSIDINEYCKLDEYDSILWRKKNGFNVNDKIIGLIGSISSNKNHLFIIKILPEIIKTNINIKLLIVGEGNKKENLKRLCHLLKLDSHVFFLGFRDDVPEILNSIDILCVPSFFEGFCLVALEAQLAGTFTLMSTNLPSDVDLKIGLLKKIKLENKQEWIENIKNNGDYKKLKKNIRIKQVIQKGYDILYSVKQIEEVYLS